VHARICLSPRTQCRPWRRGGMAMGVRNTYVTSCMETRAATSRARGGNQADILHHDLDPLLQPTSPHTPGRHLDLRGIRCSSFNGWSYVVVCVECLFLRHRGPVPYGTNQRAPKWRPTRTPPRNPPSRIPRRPGALYKALRAYESLSPGSGSGPKCFQALGSPPGLPQSPML